MTSPTDPAEKLTDAVKQLITLGSAALTLSVAFVRDLAGGHIDGLARNILRTSWVLMLLSIFAGVAVLFTFVNGVRIDNKALRGIAAVQQAAFVLSFIGLVWMAWISVD